MSESFNLEKFDNISEFVDHLIEVNSSFYKATGGQHAKYFAYDGFDPTRIAKKVMKILKDAKESDEAFKNLVDAVSIGLMRGNIRQDQLAATSDFGRTRINEIVTLFSIPLKKGKVDKVKLSSDTITFARMVSVFPFVASQLIATKVVSIDPLGCPFGSDKLPDVMRHPGFAGLIPRGNDYGATILQCHLAFMVSFGEKINPDDKKELAARFASQRNFSVAAWGNLTLYDNAHRIKIFEIFGLNDHGKYGSIYLSVANALSEALGKPKIDAEHLKKFVDKEEKIILLKKK